MAMTISGSGTITGLSAGGLPDATIVQADLAAGVAGNGPAFSAYLSSNQSITSNVATKVAFNAELFDTASCFDTATNYRFTPTVAGYYQINGGLNAASSTTATRAYGMIYKNGSLYIQGSDGSPITGGTCSTASAVIYLNGSTDYVEFYALIVAAAASIFGSGSTYTYFSGAMVRAA
jgi:hypothetical protein